MAEKARELEFNPLILDELIVDPIEAFLFQPAPLEKLKIDGLVFLDSSMLLLPYDTGPTSLQEITRIYEILAKQNRLFLPRRSIQEFTKRAQGKLSQIYGQLKSTSEIATNYPDTPGMLKELSEFTELQAAQEKLSLAIREYQDHFDRLLLKISKWHYDDPVREAYQKIFNSSHLADFIANEETVEAWKGRLAHKTPPGYEDGSKPDLGIGDFLVWKSILEKSKALKCDAIFVTNDQKNDAWHGGSFARGELIEEFRRETGGQTIRLLQPPEFLKLFGASKASIADVAEVSEYLHEKIQMDMDFSKDIRQHTRQTINWLQRHESLIIRRTAWHGSFSEHYVVGAEDFRVYSQHLTSPSEVPGAIDNFAYRHSSRIEGNQPKTIVFLSLPADSHVEAVHLASAHTRGANNFQIYVAAIDPSSLRIKTVVKLGAAR